MPDEDLAANRVESEDDQVNVLGDQDADNSQPSYQYPADAYLPTAQNVRRYPELFNEDVIKSFDAPDLTVTEPSPEVEVDETTVDDTGSTRSDDDTDTSTHVSY